MVTGPKKAFNTIELFTGAGGLALGLEKAGLDCILLNDADRDACATLRKNRPAWNVAQSDIREIDFTPYQGLIDVIAGGFPCQAFSFAGKKLGFKDARGTLFYEFARAIKEIRPSICIGENVAGLMQHDNGNTLKGMVCVLEELGYDVLPPRLLKALFYRVPQKRDRLLIVGLKRGLNLSYEHPFPQQETFCISDALKQGKLYPCDAPFSPGQTFSNNKKSVLGLVPPGGCWRDLPVTIQKQYMKKSFYNKGGKTGIARRMRWDEPCLTLLCSPSRSFNERCHPDFTRPFTVREYARIQTFPDEWEFSGSVSSQYKQIGNAVPVNLAIEIGHSIVKCLRTARQ